MKPITIFLTGLLFVFSSQLGLAQQSDTKNEPSHKGE